MAEVNNDQIIGDFTCRVPASSDRDSAYQKLAAYDAERAGHAEMHRMPASFFVWAMAIYTAVPDGGTGSSLKVTAPRPLTIWAADVGCESAGGATGVLDIRVDPVGAGADASILDAAQDVKTAAGTATRLAPEDGSEDIGYGDVVYIKGTSGAGGTIVGAQAHLYCQLL